MRGEGVEPSQAHRPTAPQTVASAIPPSSRNQTILKAFIFYHIVISYQA
jgi:hypothetical protein